MRQLFAWSREWIPAVWGCSEMRSRKFQRVLNCALEWKEIRSVSNDGS
jgi:hypothetical protein